MAQALAHAQGKRSGVRTHKVSISPDETQNSRKKWKRGQRSPTGAAKTPLAAPPEFGEHTADMLMNMLGLQVCYVLVESARIYDFRGI
jgi:hypothetical protein